MNAVFSQDTRLGLLNTVLGKDLLVLLRFTGSDHMNNLFEYRVDCLSTEPNIDFDALIGTHASVNINSQNHGLRHYDGIVTEAQWAGVGENGNKYQLTLRPWFWLASRRRNQRIFHNKTVVQIIEELLIPYAPLGSPALKVSLVEDYPELEYTVQYRESDMGFAQRLMERFGISYHFTHEAGSHTMVLTDDLINHATIAGDSRVYKPYDGHHNTEHEHFWEWHPQRRMTTGALRLTDYNFKTPQAAMEMDRIGDAQYAEGQIEAYDYPGDYLDQGRGKDVIGLRTRAERGQDARHKAIGDCTSLGSGMLITLTGDHVDGVKNTRYVCLSATHSYVSDAYGTMTEEAQENASEGYAYTGQYVLMPDSAPLVPERKTRIPVVQGPQTAVVVGDGEIDCDEFGRILVHFHWDLEKAYSMRCRVSQNWASKGWGGMVIPRIGMEVIVEFLEGDPDKPMVTGCVYNGANTPPYDLPQHKTKSVFKTDTHEGGGFNELTFEDQNDRELIYMHGQKDQEIEIENDRSKSIGRDQFETVGQDKSISIGRDHKETIGRDANRTVTRDDRTHVIRNAERQIDKDSFDYVNNQRVEYTYYHHQEEVGGNHDYRVEGKLDAVVGQQIFTRTKKHVLHAEDKFIIGGPGGTIEINSGGVIIRAKSIKFKSPSISQTGGSPDQVETVTSAMNEGLDLAEVCIKKLTEE